MIEAIILDTETTDTENAEVIELYWHSFHLDGAPRTGLHQFYLPTGEIALSAVSTHHIFKEELQGSPPSSRVTKDIQPAEYWIGHNVDFDWKVLGEPPVKRICTLAMARSIWPKIDKHTLIAMTYFLEGRTSEVRAKLHQAHGAKIDVELCEALLRRIMALEGISTLPDLYGFAEECRIPKIFSFGKFKGLPIKDADKGWANWYLRLPDKDPYMVEALRRARKI